MLEKTFYFISIFLVSLMILGIYLGYSGLISFQVTLITIIISAVISLFIVVKQNKEADKNFKSKKKKLTVLVFLIFLFFFAFLVFPEGVFPVTCSDIMNHSLATRIIGQTGFIPNSESDAFFSGIPLTYVHVYPQGFYAISAQIYTLFPNAYLVNSVLAIILTFFSAIGIFIITKKISNENSAILATLIFFSSITTLWIIESGFIPQILGSFFLLVILLAYIQKNKVLFFISSIGLISYPPLIAVLFLFLIIDFLLKSNFSFKKIQKNFFEWMKYFILAIISFFVVFPEFFGLLIQYTTVEKFWKGALLIRGGIFSPNPFGLLIFVPVLLVLYLFIFRKKKFSIGLRPCFAMLVAGLLMSGAVVFYFIINLLLTIVDVKQIHSLYQAVKFFYFALIIASIFSGIGFELLFSKFTKGKIKFILIAVLLFGVVYFFGYSTVLFAKDSEVIGFYSTSEFVESLPEGSIIGVDSCALKLDYVPNPFIYKSLFDNPDPSGENICRQTEITRAFRPSYATHDFIDGRFRIFDSTSKELVLIGNEINPTMSNINYFYTTCLSINAPLIFESGKTRIYKIN